MIFTDTYVKARVVRGTTLTYDDVTGYCRLTTKYFDT